MFGRLARSRGRVVAFAAVGAVTWASSLKQFRFLDAAPSSQFHAISPLPATIVPVTPPGPVANKTTLWDLAVPEWMHWLAAVFGAIADAVVGLFIPKQIGTIMQKLSSSVQGEGVTADFLILGGLLASKALLYFVTTVEVRRACENFAARLKEKLFSALLSRDISSFDQEGVSAQLSLITSDVRELKLTLGKVVQDGLSAGVSLIGGVIMLYGQSAPLTLLLCSTAGITFGVGTFMASALKKELSKVRDHDALTQAHASEVLSHIRTVRAFNANELELQRYAKSVGNVRDEYNRVNLILGAFGGLVAVTFSALTAGTLVAGALLDPSLNLPSFLLVASRVQSSFGNLAQLYGETQKVSGSADRVLEYLNNRPSIPLRGGQQPPATGLGRITFDHVAFAYPGRSPVFSNFSLDISPGSCVALVGKSGAGKSTVMNLILRFYDAIGVYVDGVEVKSMDPFALREMISVVEQRPLLFHGTVKENIRYGTLEATDEDVAEAARLANCDEFVSKLPHGLDTVLEGDGTSLSGGQIQRLAIARALIRKNAKILLLDEATSALDSESEKLVQEAIDNARKVRTTVIIAHRLSTVRNADRIVVMDSGKVVEDGSFEDLMGRKGLFFQMAQQQDLK